MAKYGLDRKPLIFKMASTTNIPVYADGSGTAVKYQPLYDFVNSTFYTDGVKK